MNVFNKVTLQALKKNRTRTIVTVIGVILSASMITAVTTLISSMQGFLMRSAAATFGDWAVRYENADDDFCATLANDKAVSEVLLVADLGGYLREENEVISYFPVAGYSKAAMDALWIPLEEGRLPQNEREIVLPIHAKLGYRIDDEIELDSGVYTVVGLTGYVFHATDIRTFITVMPDTPTAPYTAYVWLNNTRKVYAFNERMESEADVEGGVNSNYLRTIGLTGNESMMAVMYSLGAILIGLIMAGSILLIHNAFSISVSERTKQFGILSSVGATPKQLRGSVLFEGVCIGAVGIPLGIVSGILGIAAALGIVDNLLGDYFGEAGFMTLQVSWWAVAAAAIIGAVTILLSAYIPAKRVMKMSAMDCIRQTTDIKVSARAREFKTSKLTQKLLGFEGMLSHKNFKRNKKRYRAVVLSLFMSVVLFIAASSFGLYLKESANMIIHSSNYDVGVWAYGDVETEPLLREMYGKLAELPQVTRSAYADTSGSANFEFPVNKFGNDYLNYFPYLLSSDEYGDREHEVLQDSVRIMAVDDDTFKEWLSDMGVSEAEYYNRTDSRYYTVGENVWYVQKTKRYETIRYFDEDELDFVLYKGGLVDEGEGQRPLMQDEIDEENKMAVTLTFVNKLPYLFEGIQNGLIIVVPHSELGRFDNVNNMEYEHDFEGRQYAERVYFDMMFEVDNPMEATEAMEAITETYKESFTSIRVYNVAAGEEETRRMLMVMDLFVYGFVALMSLITVANVFNTITTNVALRRREFAMLKSVGLADGGLNKMMVYECLFFGVKSLLYGLPVSFGITVLIYLGVTQGMDVPFVLPWGSIAVAVGGVFAIVFVTMMYAVGKVKKENTIDALKSELL
ncbi:MAG: ABC transporter permease [Oscillospiraceae bacterium]|nr:ABC transporter permease [Oscillospiraceae bacterium]